MITMSYVAFKVTSILWNSLLNINSDGVGGIGPAVIKSRLLNFYFCIASSKVI